jgi:hypothetical protein
MKLCKHQQHRIIDWIKDPKWSTDEILISVDALPPNTNHLLIQFANPSPKKKYGWFYMDARMVRKHKQQKNGTGMVYVVPLAKREDFEPIKVCEHVD